MSNDIYMPVIGGIGVQSEQVPVTADPDEHGLIGLYTLTTILTAAQIATLNSSPVEIVAAPGEGKSIYPISARFSYQPGDYPFSENRVVTLLSDTNICLQSAQVDFASGTNTDASLIDVGYTLPNADVLNTALNLSTATGDPAYTGSILTSSIDTAGSDYAQGDTITINNALITVNTVSTGAVATYTVTTKGTGFSADTTYAQDSTSGSGIGFVLSVDTITALSDGTGTLTLLYSII